MICFNSQIENHLNCKICEREYQDPRIVPCGESFCQKCIDSQSNIEQATFKCVCSKKHTIPENGGFPTNKLLSALLQEKIVGRYSNQLTDDHKKKIFEIKKKINTLTFGLESSHDKIRNYCAEVRNSIDQATESLIQTIQNKRDKLLEELKKKEESYVKEFKEKSANKEEIGKSIKNLETLCNDLENKSNLFKMDEKEISQAIFNISNQIDECDLELDKYLFGKERILFEANDKPQENLLIGKIFERPLELKIDLNALIQIESNDDQAIHHDFNFNNNGDIICCQVSNKKIKINLIDNNTETVIATKEIDLVRNKYFRFFKYLIHKSKKLIVFLINYATELSMIHLLNSENLDHVKTHMFSQDFTDISVCEEYIYTLSTEKTIHKLSFSLKRVNTDITENPKFKTLQPKSTSVNLQTDKYDFEYDENSILTISRTDSREVVCSKVVLGKLCTIYDDKFVVTYDSTKRSLFYYDFKGDYAGSQLIPDHLDPAIIKCQKDMIFFYDSEKCKLYFTKNE